jgi:hypothetical protein
MDNLELNAAFDEDGEVKHDNMFYIGDLVDTKYGPARIKKIELMPEKKHYSKCGINVKKMFTSMVDQCIIDLDNGHWQYGDEIEIIG